MRSSAGIGGATSIVYIVRLGRKKKIKRKQQKGYLGEKPGRFELGKRTAGKAKSTIASRGSGGVRPI